MSDEPTQDTPSPGTEAVSQFTNEVRAGIVAATDLAVKRVARGYLVTGVVAAVVAGCVAWVVASPRPATTSFVLEHAAGPDEVCSRTADGGPPHSKFICRFDTRLTR